MLTAVFWLSVVLIGYTYIGYPLLLRLLAWIARRPEAIPSDDLNVTMLICAHNEVSSIEKKLRATLALDYPREKLQVLVASDGSADGTDDVVRRFADQGVELISISQHRGKTHAQNVAVQYARGEIIVFSDATAEYSRDALQFLAGNFRDPSVGATSGCYEYLDPSKISPSSAGAHAYASYDNKIRDLQSRVWSITGCCGAIYAVRRSLYTHLKDEIISDLVQPLHVLRKGYRVTYEPRAIASESATRNLRREFSMRVRVITRALSGLLSVGSLLAPWRYPCAAFQLWSHKLFRWAIPLFLFFLFFASAGLRESSFYFWVFAAQMAFYATAVLTYLIPLQRRWKPLGIPLFFCTINIAAVGGVFQALRGHRYTLWKPDRDEKISTADLAGRVS